MSKVILCLSLGLLASCASKPKCGNPEGARTVLVGTTTCQVRIRQLNIGSDFKIPDSLKGKLSSNFILDWREAGLVDGQIVLGHFVLVPIAGQEKVAP